MACRQKPKPSIDGGMINELQVLYSEAAFGRPSVELQAPWELAHWHFSDMARRPDDVARRECGMRAKADVRRRP